MPHRRGTFREDMTELLVRFAQRGSPAIFERAREKPAPRKPRISGDPLSVLNEALFDRPHHRKRRPRREEE